MVSTGSKGQATRQRIVELAAPVFNRQGFVGASLRDLVKATGHGRVRSGHAGHSLRAAAR